MPKIMKKLIKYLYKNQAELVVLPVVAFQLVFFPYPALAAQDQSEFISLPPVDLAKAAQESEEGKIELILPIKEYQVVKTYQLTVTAYSSTTDQTDSTPCITANGFDLCEHDTEDVIAANFLPFGTKVRLPEKFGDRIFTVEDRMNARYYYRADVWFKTRDAAKQFGAPYTILEVVE